MIKAQTQLSSLFWRKKPMYFSFKEIDAFRSNACNNNISKFFTDLSNTNRIQTKPADTRIMIEAQQTARYK